MESSPYMDIKENRRPTSMDSYMMANKRQSQGQHRQSSTQTQTQSRYSSQYESAVSLSPSQRDIFTKAK